MKTIKIYLVIFLGVVLFPLQNVLSNSDLDAESLIKASIRNWQDPNRDSSKYFEITDEKFRNANPQKLLALLSDYSSDKSYSVRQLALLYTVRIANIHPTVDIRQEVAQRLVRDLVDPNSNTSSRSYEWLLSFTKDDFNESSKEMLHKALAENRPDSSVLKICGVADMQDELPRLKELITISEIAWNNEDPIMRETFPWYRRKSWVARQARARMGVKEDIIKCIDLVESLADVIEYLKKYLDSDGYLPPPRESYASRAMHILAESLSNFPVKQSDTRSYTDEEIALCRKWMSEQKQWHIIR